MKPKTATPEISERTPEDLEQLRKGLPTLQWLANEAARKAAEPINEDPVIEPDIPPQKVVT